MEENIILKREDLAWILMMAKSGNKVCGYAGLGESQIAAYFDLDYAVNFEEYNFTIHVED